MNSSRFFLTLVPVAGLLLTGCNKSDPAASAPPSKPVAEAAPPPAPPVEAPPLVPEGPTRSDLKGLQQMHDMALQQAELQQQLEEEKLARLEAEMAAEQALLDKERAATAAAWSPEPVADVSLPQDAVHVALDSTGDSYGDYQTFYDDLAPYGTWYDSQEYGYCWQPTVCISDVSWRPYTRGCWNACDAGWAWCSDEPFGWACYHYGRWVRCRGRGWCWIPGGQWAPAWVCWRKNDDYVGWCPLPPETIYDNNCTWGPTVDTDCGIHPSCYVFVPCKHFDKPVLGYCEAPSTCLRICGNTVNCTNVVCRPGHVRCDGPQYDWITRSVRRSVPKYTISKETGREAHGRPGYKVEKDRIRFFAPKVEKPWNPALRPRANVARLEKEDYIRASSGVPEKLATRFKTERSEREKALATQDNKAVRKIIDRQQKLTEMQKNRETIAAEVQRHSETAKSKLAAGPQRSEAPVTKAPRAAAVAAAPSQTEGDVSAPPALPDRTQQQPGRTRDGIDTARQPRGENKAGELPVNNSQEIAAANKAAAARNEVSNPKRPDVASREVENDSRMTRAAQLAEQRRRVEEARTANANAERAAAAADQEASNQRAAALAELQKRQAESTARNETATRELDRQRATREQQQQQLDEKRRQAMADAEAQTAAVKDRQRQVEAQRAALAEQRQAAAARAAAEQQQRQQDSVARESAARESAVKERSRQQESARSAMVEQQRAAAEADARAEQAARQREELERQRAAMEQQRRQAEAQAQAAREEAARREAAERQQAMEQRRQQQEEQQRRQQEEHASRQREAAAQQQRQAEQQRQADENNRRQAEENTRREASERARQDNEPKRGR